MTTGEAMKFAKRYKLVKDTPTHKAGSELRWEGMDQRFYFVAPKESEFALTKSDREGPSFTVEQIQNGEWFKPLDSLRLFIPKFPSRKKISEYVSLDAETRLVDSVDECRAINGMIQNPDFQQRLYDFYKAEYEKFYKL